MDDPRYKAEALIQQLADTSLQRRVEAKAELGRFRTDSILDMLLAVQEEDFTANNRSAEKTSRIGLVSVFGGCASMTWCALFLALFPALALVGVIGFAVFAAMALRTVYVRFTSLGNRYRFEAITEMLCKSNNPRVVGALCNFLNVPTMKRNDARLNQSVTQALQRLLPRHAEQQLDLPDRDHRRALRREFRKYAFVGSSSQTSILNQVYREYIIALMRYFTGVGDTLALTEVQRAYDLFKRREPHSPLTMEAEHCLESLKAIKQAGASSAVLLRPSQLPDNGEELIRPVSVLAQTEELPRIPTVPSDVDFEDGRLAVEEAP